LGHAGNVMVAPADHWIRAEETTRKAQGEACMPGDRMLLFDGSIHPGDVVQVCSLPTLYYRS
jgi:hypothetical protein